MATSSVEEHSFGAVVNALEARGVPAVVFKTDRVLDRSENFSLTVRVGALIATYEGHDTSPGAVSAGWYRKVNSFRVPGAKSIVSRELTLVNEITQLRNSIWSLYASDFWLGDPSNLWNAERKLSQLVMAHRVGFAVS